MRFQPNPFFIFYTSILFTVLNTLLMCRLLFRPVNSRIDEYYVVLLFILIQAVIMYIAANLLHRELTLPYSLIEAINTASEQELEEGELGIFIRRNDMLGHFLREYIAVKDKNNALIREQYQNRLYILSSQMKALEAQVNTHFINNTLDAINSIAEIEEIESLSVMSLCLGRMLRYSIRTPASLVSLRNEMDHLKNYMAISQIRFNNKFRIQYDIEDGLMDQKMLKLILQPIVENSCYHGLNPSRSHDGMICLKIYTESQNLIIQVSDNGIGIDQKRLEEIRNDIARPLQFDGQDQIKRPQIGLKNINTRIQLFYGTNYGISIESVKNEGTSVTVLLPR